MQISRANIRAASLSRRFAATHNYCVLFGVAPLKGARRVAEGIKKVAKSLGSIRIKCYLCPEQIFKRMTNNSHDWVITGVNRLTGTREEISRAMSYEACMKIMERERNKKHRAFLRLRAERLTPRQLTILIEEI
jgi:hypothetical protein